MPNSSWCEHEGLLHMIPKGTRHYYHILHIGKGKLNVISLWNSHNTIIKVGIKKLKSFAYFGSFELTFLIHFLPSKELAKRLILLQSYKNSQLGTFAKDTESTTYTMLQGSGKATQECRIGKSLMNYLCFW